MRLASLFVALVAVAVAWGANPKADPKAIVQSGMARFTILFDEMIRFEYSPDKQFEDHASLAIINRLVPVPKYSVTFNNGWLVISTAALEIHYKNDSILPFIPNNFFVKFWMNGTPVQWVPEQEDTGNLYGTFRTLDGSMGLDTLNCTLQDPSAHCTPGLISRNGWSIISDKSPLLDGSDGIEWVMERPHLLNSDAYFLGYGHQYAKALRDYTALGGAVPVPPRHVFGIWFSRYWAFSDTQFRELMDEYQQYKTPLDNVVVDMDWHMTFYKEAAAGQKDQAGLTPGWTGWTWDPALFPYPAYFISYIHSKGLRTTLNLHPGSGAQPHELHYPDIARAVGIDPATKQYVPFVMENKTIITAFLDHMIKPLEGDGVDFWWLDWQQGETWTKIRGNNPTIWLNHIWWNNFARTQNPNRPLLMHRWGGLGNHRYQIGFSGDVVPGWESLQFQPKFTLAASNVLFGYWSHDIGGHTLPSPPELYTRWVQLGAFSPVLRTHCTKNAENDRRIWTYPLENFVAMRAMMVLRERLVPYIYTHARIAHDQALPLIRPMYYAYPEEDNAYKASQKWGQYFFGEDLIVSPVTQAMSAATQLATVPVWLPAGCWVDISAQKTYAGPALLSLSKRLDEVAVFARCGAILPLAPDFSTTSDVFGHAAAVPEALTLQIFPADAAASGQLGAFTLLEDDGVSTGYEHGQASQTTFTVTDLSGSQRQHLQVAIGATAGSYEGMPATRSYEIRMVNCLPPQGVKLPSRGVVAKHVSGRAAAAAERDAATWWYDGEAMTVVVAMPAAPVGQAQTVELSWGAGGAGSAAISAIVGTVQRAKQVKALLDNLFGWGKTDAFQEDFPAVIRLSETGSRCFYHPETTPAEVAGFASLAQTAASQVGALAIAADQRARALAWLTSL